jgi:uncharacterized membrane protein
MSKCSKCGEEMKEKAKYCKACGSSIGAEVSLDEKKARVLTQERQWKKPLAIMGALVLAVVVVWLGNSFYMSRRTGAHPMFPPHRDASARLMNAVPVTEQGADVRIPLRTLDDGNAHFFAYAAGGKTITFFAMKAMDGSIRTALDACVACNHAKLGYRQEGNLVVCNNCGMGFKPTDIGMTTGGCNPIPIKKSVDGQTIVLKAKDLEDGARYF